MRYTWELTFVVSSGVVAHPSPSPEADILVEELSDSSVVVTTDCTPVRQAPTVEAAVLSQLGGGAGLDLQIVVTSPDAQHLLIQLVLWATPTSAGAMGVLTTALQTSASTSLVSRSSTVMPLPTATE